MGGISFLLHNKDRYGIWYSGHATIEVLKTLLEADQRTQEKLSSVNPVLTVNGKLIGEVVQQKGETADAPRFVDLTQFLRRGKNELALSGSGASGSLISVQAVAGYYVPWSESANTNSATRTGESHALALSVDFDKNQGKVGEKITCTVKVERIGSRGYGMLLGEIGLPPGAEVDRESLDTAMYQASWFIDHYDILPDRLVVYVWPSAGGSKFQFTFKPRFSEKAKSAPSALYDYYNPDAKTVLADAVPDFGVTLAASLRSLSQSITAFPIQLEFSLGSGLALSGDCDNEQRQSTRKPLLSA